MQQPLMQELLQAIPGSHYRSGVAGVSKNMVVPVGVRGKEVLVLNTRRAATLVFGATTFDGQDLQWILKALKEDITNSPEAQGGEPAKKRQDLQGTFEAGEPDRRNQTDPQ